MQAQADYISSAFPGIDGHAITLLTAKKAIGYTAALTKSILHGMENLRIRGHKPQII